MFETARSFDMLISHTTIVFTRYLTMEWERRQENDQRSLGGLFFLFSDEIREMDLKMAMQQLILFFVELVEVQPKRKKSAIMSQVQESGLPSYITYMAKMLVMNMVGNEEKKYGAINQINNRVASYINYDLLIDEIVSKKDLYLCSPPDLEELNKLEPIYLSTL